MNGASAATFQGAIGRVISLRGELAAGEPGPRLLGATPEGITFHIIPVARENEDEREPVEWITPAADWLSAMGHQVRVTGMLKFQAGTPQSEAPGHYFMGLQHAKLERLNGR